MSLAPTVARRAFLWCAMLLAAGPCSAADLSPAQVYLQQAAAATHQIQLGGDQSAARREVAHSLLALDPQGARDSITGIGRPSDAARVLAAIATAALAKEPAVAHQAAALGGRLLQRISEPERREQEYRLFLDEIAALGADAPAAVPEVPLEEARPRVVAALAARDPEQAFALCQTWKLSAPAAEAAFARLAPRLALTKPDDAVALAERIGAPALRDRVLWLVAEARPPGEAAGIAARMQDPVARAGALASAARRLAATDPAAGLAALAEISVSPVSARAEIALETAARDPAAGAELARPLPGPARAWVLGQLACALAASQPERAEAYAAEAGGPADLLARVAAQMAPADPDRARRLAAGLPEAARAAAQAQVLTALAPVRPSEAAAHLREIASPSERDRAVAAVAVALARDDCDAATSLLGLVSDLSSLPAARARLAVAAAAKDPAAAGRLISSLPPGEARTWAAFEAGRARLAAGATLEEAVSLASLGLHPDLARRWLLPDAARAGLGTLSETAEKVENPYWRSLALVDAARALQRDEAAPRPAPERARTFRPILEWEER